MFIPVNKSCTGLKHFVVLYRELEEFYCSHNALSELPSDLLRMPQLRVLDVSYNRIQSLSLSLRPMVSLSELYLAKNKLQTLAEGTFMDMDNLAVLDIESNELQFVAPHSVRYTFHTFTNILSYPFHMIFRCVFLM